MHELAELGLIKWLISNVAVPLLGGMWALLAWWVKMISEKFSKLEDRQEKDADALHDRITNLDREHASTYARRDDVREGFARIDSKLDVLLKHALRDSQG